MLLTIVARKNPHVRLESGEFFLPILAPWEGSRDGFYGLSWQSTC